MLDVHLKPFGIFLLGFVIISNNLFHQLPFAFQALPHANCSLVSLLLPFAEPPEL